MSGPPVLREALLSDERVRYFAPPASAGGTFGNWVGIYLDRTDVDWDQVVAIVTDAYRLVAPRTLLKQLDGPA